MKTTLIQTVIFNTYYNYILTLPPDLPLSLMQVGCGNHGSEPIKEHKGILNEIVGCLQGISGQNEKN